MLHDVIINGFSWKFDDEKLLIIDPQDPQQFTTWNHLTNQERQQARRQANENILKTYYAENNS